MTDVGKNDLCPCGSGKKYKDCCLKLVDSVRRGTRRWALADLDWQTSQIFTVLQQLGVDTDEEDFVQQIERFYTAQDLSEHWFDQYQLKLRGPGQDFPWIAARELWDRLAPEVLNERRIIDMVDGGYDMEKEGDVEGACRLWLNLWDKLKERTPKSVNSIEKMDEFYRVRPALYNWCQDLELYLHSACRQSDDFIQPRADYCREFVETLPESKELIVKNMRVGEAESYYWMLECEKGERIFQKIIEDYPHWTYGYIAWGDIFAGFVPNDRLPVNYRRAREIYLMAKDKATEDAAVIDERLEGLQKLQADQS